jgi:hypothetical protein
MLLPPLRGRAITAGFVESAGGPKKRAPYQSWTAFTEALMNPLCNSEVLGQCPEGTKTSGPTRVTDVRASFARNYGAKGGPAKSADAQRQAFTRALKAALAEGLVKQDSWNGADWLWREDDPFFATSGLLTLFCLCASIPATWTELPFSIGGQVLLCIKRPRGP